MGDGGDGRSRDALARPLAPGPTLAPPLSPSNRHALRREGWSFRLPSGYLGRISQVVMGEPTAPTGVGAAALRRAPIDDGPLRGSNESDRCLSASSMTNQETSAAGKEHRTGPRCIPSRSETSPGERGGGSWSGFMRSVSGSGPGVRSPLSASWGGYSAGRKIGEVCPSLGPEEVSVSRGSRE